MSLAARQPSSWRPSGLTLLVLAVLAAIAVLLTSLAQSATSHQKRRLLEERGAEVHALLESAYSSIDSALRLVGPIGASTEVGAQRLFEESVAPMLGTGAIVVATSDGGDHTVLRSAGDGPAPGDDLDPERDELIDKALSLDEPAAVAGLVGEDRERRLVIVRRVGDTEAVIFQEVPALLGAPLPSTPDSPFRGLRVSLFASPTRDFDQLLLTTEADLPMTGERVEIPFEVGSDQWLLVVGSRGSLVGGLAHNLPWVVFAGGLVSALLVAALVEALVRRRSFALQLVDERTRDLQDALGERDEARKLIERMLSTSPLLVLRFSVPEGALTYVSPNIEALYGIAGAEAAADGAISEFISPEDRAMVGDAFSRVETGESVREQLEFRVRAGGDSFRWVSAALVPDSNGASGPVTAVVAYVVDIHERRQAEQALHLAREGAVAANQAKSEFLSRMSHELRTPLNAVLGFGQLLELDPLTDPQRDAVEHILKGGQHLLDLINEVLDISRIEAGELSLSPEPVLVSELVREAIDLIRPLADQRGVQLVADSSSSCDCYVLADRQRTKQVLLNLLSNAVKYNRPRGTVAVSCEQPDDHTRINVVDTGLGIPAERLGLLFEPFERLGAEQTGEQGTGIGLALSKRLTEAMGGRLEADSTLGRGSTFAVELPRVEGPVERFERLHNGSPQSHEASPTPSRHVILHIEDNLSNLTLVERILDQRGDVEVVGAMQGRLGLDLAREHEPALVLLDLHLPDMDGDEVLRQLVEHPATASIPVVIVSADATPGQISRLLALGAAAYLTKPLDVRELLRLVNDALVEP